MFCQSVGEHFTTVALWLQCLRSQSALNIVHKRRTFCATNVSVNFGTLTPKTVIVANADREVQLCTWNSRVVMVTGVRKAFARLSLLLASVTSTQLFLDYRAVCNKRVVGFLT